MLTAGMNVAGRHQYPTGNSRATAGRAQGGTHCGRNGYNSPPSNTETAPIASLPGTHRNHWKEGFGVSWLPRG